MEGGVNIRLARCGKTFANNVRALELVDLVIPRGETTVVLGPSGCGKTTILRIIAGLEVPDSGGRVFFDDVDVTPLPIERRNVGMVFQSYALFPNMTVAENITYGLRVRGQSRADRLQRLGEMLDMMHIRELANRRIDQLSGGQRQRVALARAIAVRPRILLLDEPLTALDAKLRDTLRIEIDGLLRRLGITSIYVTHDQTEAMALGDRIIVMNHGRIAQVGTPRDIYLRPQTAFVANFIGTMNELTGHGGGGRLTFPTGSVAWNGPDGDARVMFRPQDAQICDANVADFSGRILAAFFLGDRTRLVVEIPRGKPVIVESSDLLPYAIGDVVCLRVAPDRLIRLASSEVEH
jgi:putative spermidine/putrescine transport system ATP-binding protein